MGGVPACGRGLDLDDLRSLPTQQTPNQAWGSGNPRFWEHPGNTELSRQPSWGCPRRRGTEAALEPIHPRLGHPASAGTAPRGNIPGEEPLPSAASSSEGAGIPVELGSAGTSRTHSWDSTGRSAAAPGRQERREGGGGEARGVSREQEEREDQPGAVRSDAAARGGPAEERGAPSTHLCSHSPLPRRKHRTRAQQFPFQQEEFGARDGTNPRASSPSWGALRPD